MLGHCSAPVSPYAPYPTHCVPATWLPFTSGCRQILVHVRPVAPALHPASCPSRPQLQGHFQRSTLPLSLPIPVCLSQVFAACPLPGPFPSTALAQCAFIDLFRGSSVYDLAHRPDSKFAKGGKNPLCLARHCTLCALQRAQSCVYLLVALCQPKGRMKEGKTDEAQVERRPLPHGWSLLLCLDIRRMPWGTNTT